MREGEAVRRAAGSAGVVLAAIVTACGTRAVAPPPARVPEPPKVYTSCLLHRTLDLWATTPDDPHLPPYPAPRAAVEVRDAYCTVEANRVLATDQQCLQPAVCDDVPGEEHVVVTCTATPGARWGLLRREVPHLDDGPDGDDADWHARLAACFHPTFVAAPADELRALEAALRGLDAFTMRWGDGGVVAVEPAIRGNAYHRLHLTFAREVTQARAGIRPKAIVWARASVLWMREGVPQGLPYPHFTQSVSFGFPTHPTDAQSARQDDAYCEALRDGHHDAEARWSGADPELPGAVRRNEAVVALMRGRDEARAAVAAMPDDLVDRGTKRTLARANIALRDPCSP